MVDENFEVAWDFQNDVVESDFTLYAKWKSTLYLYEVTDISAYRILYTLIVSWTNPDDDNFSHVRVILAGFEWAESMGGTDQEPGATSYSVFDTTVAEYITIKCVGKDGSVSVGIKHYL